MRDYKILLFLSVILICSGIFCSTWLEISDILEAPQEESCVVLTKHVCILNDFNEFNKTAKIMDFSSSCIISSLLAGAKSD